MLEYLLTALVVVWAGAMILYYLLPQRHKMRSEQVERLTPEEVLEKYRPRRHYFEDETLPFRELYDALEASQREKRRIVERLQSIVNKHGWEVEAWGEDTLDIIEKRLEASQQELAEWQEAAERAANEPCHDEKHCTCVPLLRKKLEARQQELAEWLRELAREAALEEGEERGDG